jgi:1,4-alpha-glucan branching enzyme
MKKQIKKASGKRRVTFTFIAPWAQKVSLVGNFNQWRYDKHPMKKNRDDRWSKTIYLMPGTYEYKYWVDGQWMIDERNLDRCRNCFGTRNNLITIVSK